MGWNQNSRLDFLHALIVEHTFKIDSYQNNTGDKSQINGHYYSDKAPGIVILALPAFSISAMILEVLNVPIDSENGWFFSSWMTTIGSVSLITALGGVGLFAFLCPLVGQRFAFITSLIAFLGAAPFPYATMLFSHAAVAGLICIALWAIGDSAFLSKIAPDLATTPPLADAFSYKKRHILAGVCCGLAISCEFTAGMAVTGVFALALLTHFKRGVIFALAAIPAILPVFVCNWVCFGNPLAFGYHNLALSSFQEMNNGFFGISFPPTLDSVYLILLSPERGLFFWTPFFAMAMVGGVVLCAKKCGIFLITLYLTVFLHIIFISGYYMPGGGNALGPRHLACIEPFLIIFAAFGLKRYPIVGSTLGGISILLTGTATLIDAMPTGGILNPLFNYYPALVLHGQLAHNILSEIGLPVGLGAGLIFLVILGTYIWTAKNKE